MKRLAIALALAMPLIGQPLAAQDHQQAEAGPFVEGADAAADLSRAFQEAGHWIISNDAGPPPYTRRVLAIFGANWCHDSRDLAAMLERPRIAELIARQYRVVLVDAGMPQTGNGHNLDLAARYGVPDITGTPTVLVLDADGELLNSPDNARAWRNASSRSEREVYRFLRQYAKPQR
jgi:hypothetical protein